MRFVSSVDPAAAPGCTEARDHGSGPSNATLIGAATTLGAIMDGVDVQPGIVRNITVLTAA